MKKKYFGGIGSGTANVLGNHIL